MEPPIRLWQPLRGILTLIVICIMGILTFMFINPLMWIIRWSEIFHMTMVLYLVFVLFFLKGWLPRKFAKPPLPMPLILHTITILVLGPLVTYPILRALIGPEFPWILFFEIQVLAVLLGMALIFQNWPLQKLKQPIQGIGLLIIGFIVGTIFYYVFHNYSPFYFAATAVPKEVLATFLPPEVTPEYLAAINPGGAVDAFLMATLNTMFMVYICIFGLLFELWPFRLLKKQPWIGIAGTIVIIVLSLITWRVALIVYPAIITIDLGLLTAGKMTGIAPLSALPSEAQYSITMLYVLGAFEGPLIWGSLVWSAVFMWWPGLLFTRTGRAPYNRQPIKGLILLVCSIITGAIAFLGLHQLGFMLMPLTEWCIPGLIPPPFLLYLWLVICWLPGLAVYTVYYAVACESWPQPPLPPPPPDVHLYDIGKVPPPIPEERKREILKKYLWK